MPNVSLKTVYQTLNDLAELGEITCSTWAPGSARFDPNVETTHHHLVCRACGKVRDLAADFPALQVSRRAAPGLRRRQRRGRLPRPLRRRAERSQQHPQQP